MGEVWHVLDQLLLIRPQRCVGGFLQGLCQYRYRYISSVPVPNLCVDRAQEFGFCIDGSTRVVLTNQITVLAAGFQNV